MVIADRSAKPGVRVLDEDVALIRSKASDKLNWKEN